MAEKIDFNGILEGVLKGKKLDYTTKSGERYNIHTIPMRLGRSGTDIRLKMRVGADGDGKIWSFVVSNVPQRRRIAVLEALNGRMAAYRFISLYLDDENDICAGYDFEVFGSEQDAQRHIRVVFDLFVDILDKCMIDINKAVWKEEPQEEEGFLRLNLFGNEEE